MPKFRLQLTDASGARLADRQGDGEVTLAYRGTYQPGDVLRFSSDTTGILVKMRLDDSLPESWVYLKEHEFAFQIPFDAARIPYGKKAFTGERHWGYVSLVSKPELENYRNLAQNAFDSSENHSIYPHAVTNVRTDNPQFFAQNAIDGIFETSCHGSWPHGSWGINRQQDACLKICFGRTVATDCIVLYLRADFPHDNWWESIKVTFSDGDCIQIKPVKTGCGQSFSFPMRETEWVLLSDLQMSGENSLFPALSQIMVMGREVKKFLRF